MRADTSGGRWVQRFFIVASSSCLVECGVADGSDNGGNDSTFQTESRVDERVGTVSQALNTTETTIDSWSGQNLTETDATAFRNTAGTWEMMNVTNSTWGSTGRFDYGCTADTYASWCSHYLNLGSGDTAALADVTNVFASRSSTRRLYAVTLRNDTAGFWFIRTAEPCPKSGNHCANSSWDTSLHTVSNPSEIDLPQLLYQESTDDIWLVYRRNVSGIGRPVLARWHGNQSWPSSFTVFEDSCPTTWGKGIDRVRADIDSSGNIHLVFGNMVDSQIQHRVFSTATNTYPPCSTLPDVIGPFTIPAARCSSGCPNFPMVPGVASDCLRNLFIPTIAIDRATIPNNLVVSYETPGGIGCTDKTETRVYWNNNGGLAPWGYQMVTGCKTSVEPNITFAHTDGVSDTPGLVRMMTTYNTPGTTTLFQASWRSSDGGRTWPNGYALNTAKTVYPVPPSTCYWQDYNAIAADRITGSFFFSWGELNGPNWVVRGIAQNQ